jgi:hypothetical protein
MSKPSPPHDFSDRSPYVTLAMPTPDNDEILGGLKLLTFAMDNEDDQPVAPLRKSTPLKLSGEFPAVRFGGNDINVNDDLSDQLSRFRVGIVSFPVAEDLPSLNPYCFGCVGLLKNAFCLKCKSDCKSFQQNGSHAASAFNPDPKLSYYICKTRANDVTWCQFTVNTEVLNTIHPSSKDLST